jgi:hypothetical protein
MRKITLDIPDALDTEIAQYLLCVGLEHRDKGRLMLFATEALLKDDAPAELITRCNEAKEAIRDRAKRSWVAKKAYNKAIDEEKI